MPFISPDFSEALKPRGVPSGTYQARIKGAEHTQSKKSGEPMIKWTFEIFGGEADQEAQNGMTVNAWTMLKGPAAGKLRDLYKAVQGEDMPAGGFDTDDLLGREVCIVCVQRFDDDGNVNRFPDIKGYRKAGIPF